MDKLLKKLQSMGVDFGNLKPAGQADQLRVSIDEVVNGRWENSSQHRIFVSEKKIPRSYIHGNETISFKFDNDKCLDVFGLDIKSWHCPDQIVFLDTETSSLNTGAGSFVFLVGFCYVESGHISVEQIFLDDLANEAYFLSYLDHRMESFTTAVTYNGKSFDFPMLKSRFILNKLAFGLNSLEHIDLLHTARRIWNLRLDSHRLSDIESNILGFNRLGADVPGWLVPQIYFDYLDTSNASELKGVFYHNEMDVVSLAALFGKVLELTGRSHMGKNGDSIDMLAIGEIFRKRKNFESAEKFYRRGLSKKPLHEIPVKLIRHYAKVLKKQGKLDQAIPLWEKGAEMSDELSCVELAKYYEHQIRDYDSALLWVHKAIQLLVDKDLNKKPIEELFKRKDRLLRKRGRNER